MREINETGKLQYIINRGKEEIKQFKTQGGLNTFTARLKSQGAMFYVCLENGKAAPPLDAEFNARRDRMEMW